MRNHYLIYVALVACVLRNSPHLNAQCLVSVDAGEDLAMCTGRQVTIKGSVEGEYHWIQWEPLPQHYKSYQDLVVTVTQTTTYTLRVRSYDPSQNLIQNPDFEQGSTGFTSDLTYSPGDILPPGTFDVLTNPQMSNDTLLSCGDHTSGSSNMLALHLSPQNIGQDVWRQTVPVTPATSYYRIFHFSSLNTGVPSTLTLLINGVSVATFYPGFQNNCTWYASKGVWYNDNATTAELVIRVLNSGSTAAVGLDDIHFGPVCEVSDSVTVFVGQPQAAALPASYIIPCAGVEQTLNGSASSVGPQFEYLWQTGDGNIVSGANTLHPVVNSPGGYTLTVSMPNAVGGDCPKSTTVYVAEAQPPLTTWVTTAQALSCLNNTVLLNGQANQPTGNLTYQWSAGPGGNIVSGANSPSATVNQPGEYTLLVTNAATGCTAETSFALNPPVPPTANIPPPPALHPNDTLTLTASIQPANGTVSWSTPDGHIAAGTNTPTPNITSPGTYIVTVTNPANGCTGTASILVLAAAPCPVSANAGEDVFLCEPGAVMLHGSATGPLHNVYWWPETGLSSPTALSPMATVPQTTEYVLTVRAFDPGLNLLTNADFEIGNTGFLSELTYNHYNLNGPRQYDVTPFAPSSDPAYPRCNEHTTGNGYMLASSPTDTSAHLNLWCQTMPVAPATEYLLEGWALRLLNSGDITFLANGDTIGYYSAPADTCVWGKFSNIWFSGTHTSAALCIGTKDPDLAFALDDLFFTPLCSTRDTVVVQVAENPVVAVANAPDALTCLTDAVLLHADGSGGGPLLDYQWSTANGNIQSGADTPTPLVDAAGTYTLQVTDLENGCTATAEITVSTDLAEPNIAVLPVPPLTCTLTAQTLQGQNASPSGTFAYLWTASGGGQIASGETTLQPEIAAPGTYALLATNADNGCTATAEITVSADLDQPDIAVLPAPPLTCTLTAQTLQGQNVSPSGSFTYLWTAFAGGQIVSGETILQPEIAAPGTYALLATNADNGCTATAEISVNADLAQPDIAVQPAPPLTCTLTAQTLNGQNTSHSGTFTYQWMASGGGQIASGETTLQPEIAAPGTYALLATNADNGCTATAEITVSADLAQPDIAVLPALPLTCTLTAQTLQGQNHSPSGTFTYLWTASAGGQIASGETTLQPEIAAPGTYALLATNADNGCTATAEVTVLQLDDVSVALILDTDATCFGAADGALAVAAGGGDGTFAFLWDNGADTPVAGNLTAGTYTVVVTDGTGCTASFTAVVSQPDPVLPNATATPPTTFGSNDGSATASPSGGTPPYAFLWSNGKSEQTIAGLTAGMYTVAVTDANGCTAEQTVEVMEVACNLAADLSANNPNCVGAADGAATAMPLGGLAPFEYLWSNGATDQTATGLASGVYSVVITDANGCTAEATATLQATDTTPPVVQGSPATLLLGPAGSVTLTLQNLNLTATDNCGVENIQIEPVQFDCQQLGQQSVTVTVTDASGNATSLPLAVTVTDDQPPAVECPQDMQRCHDDRKVQYLAPVATDNCLLLGGGFDLVQGLPSGAEFPVGATVNTYTFTDASGNVGSCSFTVTVLSPLVVTLDALLDDLAAQNIGSVLVSVSGSRPGYTFVWHRNGQPFATTEDLIGVGLGDYTLLVTDTEGCTTIAGPFVVDDLVSTKNPDWAAQVQVYPNPTSGQVFVVLPELLVQQTVRFTVLDVAGKLVLEQQVRGNKQVELDWQHLAEGQYVLLALTQFGQAAYRVVVVK